MPSPARLLRLAETTAIRMPRLQPDMLRPGQTLAPASGLSPAVFRHFVEEGVACGLLVVEP